MSHDGSTAADTTAPPGRHPFGLSTPARSGGPDRVGAPACRPTSAIAETHRPRVRGVRLADRHRTRPAMPTCTCSSSASWNDRDPSAFAARSALNRWRRMPMHFTDHDEEGETRGPSSSPAGGSALVDLHQLVVATRGTGPSTPLGPSDHHRGVCAHGGCRGRGRTHRVAHQALLGDGKPLSGEAAVARPRAGHWRGASRSLDLERRHAPSEAISAESLS
jgi:hypothetical protein